MTPLPDGEHAAAAAVRWMTVDARTWEARWGSDEIATVSFGSRYVVRLVEDDVTGFHTSLESAKAQVEAWVRWRSGSLDPE